MIDVTVNNRKTKYQKINTLSMISPVTNEEKQKLLESLTIKDKINSLENIFSSVDIPIAVHCEDETTIKDNLKLHIKAYGQEIPITTGESLGTNNSNPFRTTSRQEVGIELEITPQINEGSSVILNIKQGVSGVAGVAESGFDLITNKREIETTVLADNGEILVLGGLISEDIQESVNKVPLLGDLPILGALFRSSAKSIQERFR